ncbi:MAG: ABC transporter permease, partial [Pseudomonadota bacterium]
MTALADPSGADPVTPERQRRAWTKFRKSPSALLGGALVAFFVIVAVLAPLLPVPGPAETDWSAVRKAPSTAHPFGTDEIGRDVLSRMIWGAQASLLAGVVSVLIAVALGVPLGVLAGYRKGW